MPCVRLLEETCEQFRLRSLDIETHGTAAPNAVPDAETAMFTGVMPSSVRTPPL